MFNAEDNLKIEAAIWFADLKDCFKGSVYEQYLNAGIEALKKSESLPILEQPDEILDVRIEKYNGLSNRAYNRLSFAGFHVMRDFTYVTKRNILRIRNAGKCTAEEIYQFTEDRGLFIRDDCINLINAYHFDEGERVRLRLDTGDCKRGDIVNIVKIYQPVSSAFRLSMYDCKTASGKTLRLSPGEIMHE